MAGGVASSSSSAALCSSDSKQYDVFISFRGKDTRRKFISHLVAALVQNQIRAYQDNIDIKKGKKVWPSLVNAIEDSYLCIVIFSKNYSSSTWCLKELTHIVKSKKKQEVIIPVFYGVDPSHVRKQTGSYKKAFRTHNKNKKLKKRTVKKWRASLGKAANFGGYDSKSKDYPDENQFIQIIVKGILQKLESIYPKNEAQGLVGIDEARIEAALKKYQIIGLWGIGGIGKTTLARHVFNKYGSQYQGHWFLANIKERAGKHGHGLDELRNELFSMLLKKSCPTIASFDEIRLKRMDVLVVLDDVDTIKQIEYLVGVPNYFGSHSRIIITTRNKHVLSMGVDLVCKVKELNFQDSLKLFSLKAFGKDHPKIGFEDLSKRAIILTKGIPLVLDILGSFLRGRSEKVWESELKKYKRHPHYIIQDALRLSYDELDNEVKEIFLDIAFFFKGHKKDEVEKFLEDYYLSAISGLEVLLDRAFITINSDGDTVEMHDLIQKFGWDIVHQECKDPRGRTRLKDPEEIYDVMKKGSDMVKGIILDMSQLSDLHLSGETLKKMPKLRLVKFYYPNLWFGRACKLYLPLGLELFSDNSRHHHRHVYGECLSSVPCFKKQADECYIPDIHVSKLEEEVQDLQNLMNWKGVDLGRSKWKRSMVIIPNSSIPEWVRPSCKNLCHVDPAILYIRMFVKTDISCCIKVKSPRDEVLSSSTSHSLRDPFFGGCSSVKQFSLTSVERRQLDITNTSVSISPSSGKCFINVEELFLHDFFKNSRNECGQQRSLEQLRISIIRQLDTWNLCHIHDVLRSIERLSFCESCELSQTLNIEMAGNIASSSSSTLDIEMASNVASSSSSAGLCSSDLKARDVFISFRGQDTGWNFTSHLYAALLQNQIRVFKDDTILEKGNEVWPSLVPVIEDSYLCIVIFSKNYASSTRCLKELTHILESKKKEEVMPLFYGVDPSHVGKQTGSYKKAFQKHEQTYMLEKGTVKKWRASLEKAASFRGYDSKSNDHRDENQFINTTVKDILQKLESLYPKSEAQGLVGIDQAHIKESTGYIMSQEAS